MGWGQGRESSHLAEAGHSAAGLVAFGLAGEKGGNVRNILTQQSPPSPSLRGLEGGLIAENIQMVEACPPLPPCSILSSPVLCLGRRLGIDMSETLEPPKDPGRQGRKLREGGRVCVWGLLLTLP